MAFGTRNIFHLSSLLVSALFILSGCGRQEWRKSSGGAWATAFHITYRSDTALEDSIQNVIADVNSSLSVFEESSTVSRINRNEDMTCDNLFMEVFEMSNRVNRLSGGAFDPTVSPAVDFWGFGYRKLDPHSGLSLDSIRSLVGIDECIVSERQVKKKSPDTEFNFSAIAKGYGCDLIGRMFRRNGVNDFLVEIGGEISAGGFNPQGKPWKISIVMPEEGIDGIASLLVGLHDCGMATSGNYRNYHDTETGRIGHTIDPITCLPVENGVFSATVIAPTTMFADALATACMVLTPEMAIGMIDGIDEAEALLIVKAKNKDGCHIIEMSAGFNKYLYENQEF